MASPRPVVDAPPLAPLPYGLLSVVEPMDSPDQRWQNGVLYEEHCGMGGAWYDDCINQVNNAGTLDTAPDAGAKTDTSERQVVGAQPFTVLAEFDCSPVDDDDQAARATEQLQRSEGVQAETAFWTGRVRSQEVVFPHLAANVTVSNDDALFQRAAEAASASVEDVATGLGLLERDMAQCFGGVGVVHIPRHALPTFIANRLVQRNAGQLVTVSGNLVAAGAGYPGTAPDGTAASAGAAYIYGTPPVAMYRSTVRVRGSLTESIDKATNTVRRIAERTYLFTYTCCLITVEVELGVPPAGS